ncbi:MAG: DNA gyrase inhibitor YacG, partial [Phycisphaerales bacterium]
LAKSVEEPYCHKKFFPFCCERCKLLDLGAWLNADYRIASGSNSDELTEPPDADAPSSDTQ